MSNPMVGGPAGGQGPEPIYVGLPVRVLARELRKRWLLLVFVPLLVGLATYGFTFLVPPSYTARTTLLPPQASQNGMAAALAALGPLASLTGGMGAARNTGDQYVALMQSATVTDSIVERFGLMEAYGVKFRVDARKELAGNVRIGLGRKDGLISIEVDDNVPARAADIANRYVEELRAITAGLAIGEAQQRRVFFEQQLKSTQARLVKAQQDLQAGGFNAGAIKAEPRAAAEGYARLRADVTAAEVRLEALRGSLTDAAPEVRHQMAVLGSMRAKLVKAEQVGEAPAGNDYVSRFREFKYQEALFELYARQFELARVDESREGALIQVVDAALPPERPSKPKRAVATLVAVFLVAVMLLVWIVVRHAMQAPETSPRSG